MQTLFDTQLILQRRLRALRGGDASALFLMERVADDLAERLSTVERRFANAAAIWCTTPHAAAAVAASGRAATVTRVEPDAAFFDGEGGLVGDAGLVSEAGHVPLDADTIDLAVSLLALQEVNDIPGALIQIRRALRPDGLFLAAFAGAGTLEELRQSLLAAEVELSGGAAPRVIPFTDVRDAGGLLQRAGFALPVADVDTVTVRYDSMFGLLRDLRGMGATNALRDRSRRPATRQLFARAAEIYAERFADADGRVRATFSIIWLSGWTPHQSQQKPLKPGEGQVSLAKILGSGENG